MKFEDFFNFHIKWLSFIGFRFKFEDYKLPKMLTGNLHFWIFAFLQFLGIAFNSYYMTIARTLETQLLGTCNLIYVMEAFIKSQLFHFNTGKIDALLFNLKSQYDSTKCYGKFLKIF